MLIYKHVRPNTYRLNIARTNQQPTQIMKNIQKIVLFLFVALSFQSCIPRYVDRNGRPIGQMNPGGPNGQRIIGYNKVQSGVKKTEIARFEARLWNSEDPVLRQKACDYAARYFEKHRQTPSNEVVSRAIGHRCQVRMVGRGYRESVEPSSAVPAPPATPIEKQAPERPLNLHDYVVL